MVLLVGLAESVMNRGRSSVNLVFYEIMLKKRTTALAENEVGQTSCTEWNPFTTVSPFPIAVPFIMISCFPLLKLSWSSNVFTQYTLDLSGSVRRGLEAIFLSACAASVGLFAIECFHSRLAIWERFSVVSNFDLAFRAREEVGKDWRSSWQKFTALVRFIIASLLSCLSGLRESCFLGFRDYGRFVYNYCFWQNQASYTIVNFSKRSGNGVPIKTGASLVRSF